MVQGALADASVSPDDKGDDVVTFRTPHGMGPYTQYTRTNAAPQPVILLEAIERKF